MTGYKASIISTLLYGKECWTTYAAQERILNVLNESQKNPQICLYGELIVRKHNLGRPQLRYRDVCKWDMKERNIDLNK